MAIYHLHMWDKCGNEATIMILCHIFSSPYYMYILYCDVIAMVYCDILQYTVVYRNSYGIL